MSNGFMYVRYEAVLYRYLARLLGCLVNNSNIKVYRYQERLESVELDWADKQWKAAFNQTPPSIWSIGRVFCNELELRWQVSDGQSGSYDIQILTETKRAFLPHKWTEIQFAADDEHPVYLWGERKAHDTHWSETRIPHSQKYPVEQNSRNTMVAVYAREYRCAGIVQTTRLTRIETIARPEE